MTKWKRKVTKHVIKLAKRVKNPFSKLKLELKQQLGWLGVPQILPYHGFGNSEEVILKGSVLEDKGLLKPDANHSTWQNMLAMLKRFQSDEIPGVRLRVNFLGESHETITNEDGFFEIRMNPSDIPPGKNEWHEVEVELLDDVVSDQGEIRSKGEIMLSQSNSQYGVISDVDDTILISKATNTFKKLRLMLFKNAHTRLPFEGVAAFYRALQKGKNSTCFNPIFYVSSSEWNLYDLLVDFCAVRGIPKGPFLLQPLDEDWYKFWKPGNADHSHKMEKIRLILNTYENLNFILIGDSGQKDAEIYSRVVKEYPDRILAIYIRDIGKKRKKARVIAIGKGIKKGGVDMIVVKDTEEAAKHAIRKGFIEPGALKDIHEEYERDHNAPSDFEQMMGRE